MDFMFYIQNAHIQRRNDHDEEYRLPENICFYHVKFKYVEIIVKSWIIRRLILVIVIIMTQVSCCHRNSKDDSIAAS